jgi:hypothetical protein
MPSTIAISVVATSGATLFRLIGGSAGTAVLGAIFVTRLGVSCCNVFRRTRRSSAPGSAITAELLASLSPTVRAAYAAAFSASLTVLAVAPPWRSSAFCSRGSCRAAASRDHFRRGH